MERTLCVSVCTVLPVDTDFTVFEDFTSSNSVVTCSALSDITPFPLLPSCLLRRSGSQILSPDLPVFYLFSSAQSLFDFQQPNSPQAKWKRDTSHFYAFILLGRLLYKKSNFVHIYVILISQLMYTSIRI